MPSVLTSGYSGAFKLVSTGDATGLVTDHGALCSYELSGDSSASTALGPNEQKAGWVQIKPSTLPLASSCWDTARSCYQMWILDTLPPTELLTDAADPTDKESSPLTSWF